MTKNSAVPPIARATTAARHPKGTLAATILGSSLAFIDGSVVNVALPAVERDLASSGASGASIGWLINAYLLTLGALVLVGGVAGDRYGRKRMFLAGIAVFTVASLGCALAPGFAWLLAARALQGVGAALLVPASLAILGAAFEGEARGRAVGTWAAASAITAALGPLVGGWLVDAVELAGDLPHQPADRRRRRVALVARGRGEPERRDTAARSRRRSARDRRASGSRRSASPSSRRTTLLRPPASVRSAAAPRSPPARSRWSRSCSSRHVSAGAR